MNIIYSLGSSLRTAEEFIHLLQHYRIKSVIDVRRFPTSKLAHFKKEELENLLSIHTIHYYYLGDKLGGYRPGGYEAYTTSKEFLAGLEELETIARQSITGFMCAELLPWRCHRRFIGRKLVEKGWQVIHILNEKRVWQPSSDY
jgi:uncharacterized protein (DUF488 family)